MNTIDNILKKTTEKVKDQNIPNQYSKVNTTKSSKS